MIKHLGQESKTIRQIVIVLMMMLMVVFLSTPASAAATDIKSGTGPTISLLPQDPDQKASPPQVLAPTN